MKKFLKIFLVIAIIMGLALTITGCAEKEEKDDEEIKDVKEENNKNEQSDVFSIGSWNNDKYTNSYIDIEFTLPKGWKKSTDAEIAAMMNVGVELLNADQQVLAEQAKNGIYCMQASEPISGASITILMEKQMMEISPSYYLTAVKQQLEAVESMDYTISSPYSTTLAGDKYYTIDAEANFMFTTVEQKYYAKAKGQYMVCVIITTTQEGQLEQILKCIK